MKNLVPIHGIFILFSLIHIKGNTHVRTHTITHNMLARPGEHSFNLMAENKIMGIFYDHISVR